MTPRVVTGVGVVCAAGAGREAFVEGLRGPEPTGRPAKSSLGLPDYAGVSVSEAGWFDAADFLGDKGLRSLDRLSKILIVATRLALRDAGLKDAGEWRAASEGDGPWADRVGMVVSNAYGSLEAIHELDRVALLEDRRYINPARFPLTVSNSAAGYASIWEDVRALNVSVCNGNSGALDTVACADMFLESARAEALLVGGAEALSEALPLAFHRLGVAGVRIGEAAALLVLETVEGARARRAEMLAEVTGYGTSFRAPNAEAAIARASPEALERAIGEALADACVSPGEVDVVVSGLSGLRAFDAAELLAIRHAVSEETFVVAPKLALGETFGAGGAIGMLCAIAQLRWKAAPPVVHGALRGHVRTALVTSLGYYGHASALVMRAASR